MQPHQRHTLSLAAALGRRFSKVDTSNTLTFTSISRDFLLFLSVDSKECQVEMEQWKDDLRAAQKQVSLTILLNSHF